MPSSRPSASTAASRPRWSRASITRAGTGGSGRGTKARNDAFPVDRGTQDPARVDPFSGLGRVVKDLAEDILHSKALAQVFYYGRAPTPSLRPVPPAAPANPMASGITLIPVKQNGAGSCRCLLRHENDLNSTHFRGSRQGQ